MLSFVLPGSMTPVENEHDTIQETSNVENTPANSADEAPEEQSEETIDNTDTEADNFSINSESYERD